jgi:hypothetical protein
LCVQVYDPSAMKACTPEILPHVLNANTFEHQCSLFPGVYIRKSNDIMLPVTNVTDPTGGYSVEFIKAGAKVNALCSLSLFYLLPLGVPVCLTFACSVCVGLCRVCLFPLSVVWLCLSIGASLCVCLCAAMCLWVSMGVSCLVHVYFLFLLLLFFKNTCSLIINILNLVLLGRQPHRVL